VTSSVTRRVAEIEEALANALRRGDFEVVTIDGERYLRPILRGHVMEDAIWSYPLLSLDAVARDLERLLS
jgi:hypothetical protein